MYKRQAYNKDNQEDKEPLFDTVETLHACLHVFADMVPTIQAKKENMYQSALKGHTTATDLADYLVKKGVTFRDAHEIIGQAVSYAINENKDLSELSLKELKVLILQLRVMFLMLSRLRVHLMHEII